MRRLSVFGRVAAHCRLTATQTTVLGRPRAPRQRDNDQWKCPTCGSRNFNDVQVCRLCSAAHNVLSVPSTTAVGSVSAPLPEDEVLTAREVKYERPTRGGPPRGPRRDGHSSFKSFGGAAQRPQHPQRGGGGRAGDNPGDWKCRCGATNFSYRKTCFRCQGPPTSSNSPPPSIDQQQQQQPAVAEDDWMCNCGATNGGSLPTCRQCAAQRQ